MLSKTKFKIILFFLIVIISSGDVFGQRVKKVVIDAGHGGKDSGAVGKKSREKDITLKLALKLRDEINKRSPEVKTILTRDSDVFVELHRRAKIANQNKADLFISIHCNAAKNRAAYGTETFVMGINKSAANLEVAKTENAAILLEDNYVMEYDGFDPFSPEGNIFFSMMQNTFLDKSLQFAGNVQHEFTHNLKRHNRGVRQDVFLVLYKTAMPAVLIEVGFISNAEEEKYIMSEKGQNELVNAIYTAFFDYNNSKIKKYENVLTNDINDTPMASTNTDTASEVSENVTNNSSIIFKVQFETSSSFIPLNSRKYRGIKQVGYYKQNNLYKYTSGECSTFEEADNLCKEMRQKGYKDAFVAAFSKGVRMDINKAKELSSTSN